jgi:hypothetical protein
LFEQFSQKCNVNKYKFESHITNFPTFSEVVKMTIGPTIIQMLVVRMDRMINAADSNFYFYQYQD